MLKFLFSDHQVNVLLGQLFGIWFVYFSPDILNLICDWIFIYPDIDLDGLDFGGTGFYRPPKPPQPWDWCGWEMYCKYLDKPTISLWDMPMPKSNMQQDTVSTVSTPVCFEISNNVNNVLPKPSLHSVGFDSNNQIRLISDQFGLRYNYVEHLQYYDVHGKIHFYNVYRTEYFVSNINEVPTYSKSSIILE